MAKRQKRYFVLVSQGKKGIFTGSQPRRAALKAATLGLKEIRLRERGKKKVHIYVGERVKVSAPENRPAWLPAKIWQPRVRKKGIEHIAKKVKPKLKKKSKITKRR